MVDEDIQPWLHFADSDMLSAETLHGSGQELNAIFHLQQAVEKTLKALWVKRRKAAAPRIHNLRDLVERLGLDLAGERLLILEKLSEYYVESRYPGDWQEEPAAPVGAEAEHLIRAAKEFIAWLRSQI